MFDYAVDLVQAQLLSAIWRSQLYWGPGHSKLQASDPTKRKALGNFPHIGAKRPDDHRSSSEWTLGLSDGQCDGVAITFMLPDCRLSDSFVVREIWQNLCCDLQFLRPRPPESSSPPGINSSTCYSSPSRDIVLDCSEIVAYSALLSVYCLHFGSPGYR